MNKISFALLSAFLLLPTFSAQAAFEGPNHAQSVTIAEVKTLPDESQVSLKGSIVNSLGDEKYTFKDVNDTIVVEIEDDDWNGLDITPQNQIEIIGEVDKDLMEPIEIEVEKVNLIK